jgi:hypothetical protein
LIVSPINEFDTFPFPSNVLDLDTSDGDEIVSLNSTGDKVFVFKTNMLYIVDIAAGVASEFFVESKIKYKGVTKRHHVVETSDGLFWANKYSAYVYTGDKVIDLFYSSEEETKNVIDKNEWANFFSDNSLVGYNPTTKECFVVKSHTHTESTDGDCYIYNFVVQAWSYGTKKFWSGGTSGSNTHMTNIVNIGLNEKMSYIIDVPYDEADDGGPPG